MNTFDMLLKSLGLEGRPASEISVKFKDRVCYHGGARVEYDDLSVFTLMEDGTYGVGKPVGKSLPGKEIDLLPLLCIGMAVAAAAQDEGSGDCLADYGRDMLDEVTVFKSFHQAVDMYSAWATDEYSRDCVVNFAYSLMACHPDDLFEMERNLAMTFFALAVVNRKEFARVLFKCMRYMAVNIAGEPWKAGSARGFKVYGCAEYKTESGAMRRITDSRGLGYMLFVKLTSAVYATFAGFPADLIEIVDKGADECIATCIGKDIAGRYISGRGFLPAKREEYLGMSSLGYVVFEPHKRFEVNNRTSSYREAYENALMYQRVYGGSDESTLDRLGCPNMRWFSPMSLLREIAFLAFDYQECAENLFLEEEKISGYLNRVASLEEMVKKLKQEKLPVVSPSQVVAVDSGEVEALKAQIKDLTWQLSEKSGIVERLSSELADLKSCMANYYSSDEPEESDSFMEMEAGDLSEIVRYLNDFKFLLVGGRMDLVSRLEKIGWTNIVSLDTATAGSSQLPQADFAVLNTGFVSHKLVYLVNSRYDRNLTMYYNGTNVGQLVRSAYDFVKRYLEGGIAG